MSLSVRPFVSLSARVSTKLRGPTSPDFLFLLTVAVDRSSYDGVCDKVCTSGYVIRHMFPRNGPMARYVYSQAPIEHDNRKSRGFNQILLDDKDRKYSL